MKIVSRFDAQVLNKNTNVSKDGTKHYYNITVYFPESGDAGMLNVSEDVYPRVPVGDTVSFLAEFNDQYKTFRVVGVDNE